MYSLVECKCKICGCVFKVKRYDINSRNMCESVECHKESKRLAMKVYRATDKGKAMTRFLNLRYKRPDIDKTCHVCGEAFKTARENRYICSKAECQDRGKYLRQTKYRANNIKKSRARDVVNKAINRQYVNGNTMKREPCLVCGEEKTEAHHHNYQKPRDVTFLCNPHHFELHSWDSN